MHLDKSIKNNTHDSNLISDTLECPISSHQSSLVHALCIACACACAMSKFCQSVCMNVCARMYARNLKSHMSWNVTSYIDPVFPEGNSLLVPPIPFLRRQHNIWNGFVHATEHVVCVCALSVSMNAIKAAM